MTTMTSSTTNTRTRQVHTTTSINTSTMVYKILTNSTKKDNISSLSDPNDIQLTFNVNICHIDNVMAVWVMHSYGILYLTMLLIVWLWSFRGMVKTAIQQEKSNVKNGNNNTNLTRANLANLAKSKITMMLPYQQIPLSKPRLPRQDSTCTVSVTSTFDHDQLPSPQVPSPPMAPQTEVSKVSELAESDIDIDLNDNVSHEAEVTRSRFPVPVMLFLLVLVFAFGFTIVFA